MTCRVGRITYIPHDITIHVYDAVYVQCMYSVCTVYVQCMYSVCTVYVQCTGGDDTIRDH
jgi:hypothetical protein